MLNRNFPFGEDFFYARFQIYFSMSVGKFGRG